MAVEHKFGLFDRRAVVWAVEAHRSDQLSARTNDVKPINVHTRRSLGSGGSFIDSLSPTNAEVGALIKPACALRGAGRKIIRAGAPAFCLHPTAHIFWRSNPADRAIPENRPRCALTKRSSMRSQNQRGPRRSWRRCRSHARPDSIPDRSRSATPAAWYRAD